MKKKICTITFSFALMFLLGISVHGQELYHFSNSSIDEETISPVYQFDYIPDFTYDQVDKRIKAMQTDMPFELNDRIFSFINYFVVRNREYTKMVLKRKAYYFPLFEETLAEHDMPDDIKYLSIIESGLNPKAKSRVGAMGLWQFMPATGRMYNLHVNRDIDDRMDPEMSTEAAARYLKSLYRMFGDWELALAAYNCGPGNVRKAINRSGGKRTFWGIYNHLPKETRSYVPQFQAMMYVLRYAEEHNLFLEEPSYPIVFEKVRFNQEIDLEQLAAISGTCLEDIEFLNPSIQNRLIPSSHQHIALRLPRSKAEWIAQNQENYASAVKLTSERTVALRSASTPVTTATVRTVSNNTAPNGDRIAYKVKQGDVLGKIAQQYGTSVTQIKNWNNLSSNTIKVGQTLYIYSNKASLQNALADNATNIDASNPRYYTVQPGDSLWLISKKLNGVTVDQIKKLNNLNTNQIKPGQKLIIG
ncbi:lytic transglycosylase domain-containing protein [Cecembia rubra]|uniref:lytic transglycosylase domain-containing protein n=1 Tax=Cecembia rubra TaxID=1485585 RepID=UPI002714C2C1|nr:lytic transglycosylase domain-containing protein [Cecembia rubra]